MPETFQPMAGPCNPLMHPAFFFQKHPSETRAALETKMASLQDGIDLWNGRLDDHLIAGRTERAQYCFDMKEFMEEQLMVVIGDLEFLSAIEDFALENLVQEPVDFTGKARGFSGNMPYGANAQARVAAEMSRNYNYLMPMVCGTGCIVRQEVDYAGDYSALNKRLIQELKFELRPVPMWVKKRPDFNRANLRLLEELEIGADCQLFLGHPPGEYLLPHPTALLTTFLHTHAVNQYLEGYSTSNYQHFPKRLLELDTFVPHFSMPRFEASVVNPAGSFAEDKDLSNTESASDEVPLMQELLAAAMEQDEQSSEIEASASKGSNETYERNRRNWLAFQARISRKRKAGSEAW